MVFDELLNHRIIRARAADCLVGSNSSGVIAAMPLMQRSAEI